MTYVNIILKNPLSRHSRAPLVCHSREGGNPYSRGREVLAVNDRSVVMDSRLRGNDKLKVKAIIDTSVTEMRIPAKIALQLGIKQIEKRNGISYVCLQVETQACKFFTGALVTGNEVILGSVAMSEMEYGIVTVMTAKVA